MCLNYERCHFEGDAKSVAEHERKRACVICKRCNAKFGGESMDEAVSKLEAHIDEAVYVPCEDPPKTHIKAKTLKGHLNDWISYDYETAPAGQEEQVQTEHGVRTIGGVQTPKHVNWWLSPSLSAKTSGMTIAGWIELPMREGGRQFCTPYVTVGNESTTCFLSFLKALEKDTKMLDQYGDQ